MLSVSQAAPVPKKNRPAGKNAGAVAAYSMAGWTAAGSVLAAASEPGLTVAVSPTPRVSRTMAEVQSVFQKNAVEFYAIYLEALKEDPSLRGKIVVSMNIEPTGKVSSVGLVSSDIENEDVMLAVLRKVEGLNFGQKPGAVMTVTDYPINFVPLNAAAKGGPAVSAASLHRRTTVVQAPNGVGPDLSKPGMNGRARLPGRTLEEIQLVFDSNKARFYSAFNRALRDDPSLRGKMMVSLTISPSGKVQKASLVSSEIPDEKLMADVVRLVEQLEFGAKNVPEFTYPNYPIVFLPT